jgi:hypothetical protein
VNDFVLSSPDPDSATLVIADVHFSQAIRYPDFSFLEVRLRYRGSTTGISLSRAEALALFHHIGDRLTETTSSLHPFPPTPPSPPINADPTPTPTPTPTPQEDET